MKVLVVNSLYSPHQVGGAERSVETLVQGLVSMGTRVDVATLHQGSTKLVEDRGDARVHRLPLRNIYWPFAGGRRALPWRLAWHVCDMFNPRALTDVYALIKQVKPDVVHTNNLSGFSVAAWRAAKRAGVPVVHTARDYYLLHPNSTLFALGRAQDERALSARAWSLAKKYASRYVDQFVGISRHVVDMHARNGYFPKAAHGVIYNSVQLPTASPRNGLHDPECPRFGYLGRLDPAKGIEQLLGAMRSLEGARLMVAGTGDPHYTADLKQLAPPNVEFVGRQEPAEFLGGIDFLVVPSLWAEPLGRVVLEAYSQGVPVVAARVGGLAETVVDGVAGALYDPIGADAGASLIAAMHRVLALPYPEASKRGLREAERYTSERIANAYLGVFEKVASRETKAAPTFSTGSDSSSH